MKIKKMKNLFLRAATMTLFLAVTLLAASICRSQTLDRDQALQVLADNSLEELSPGVWSLKGSQENNFAARKVQRMKGNKKIREALRLVGGKLKVPEAGGTRADFDSTIEPPPEDSLPPKIKKEPQPKTGNNPRPASPPKPTVFEIPSKDNRKQALRDIQDAFEVEYAAAQTPEKQKDLATALSEFIQDEPDPAIRYVLFEEVYKLHTKAGDADNSFKTVDQLQAGFPDIDPLRYKYYGLKQIVGNMSGGSDGREAYQGLRPIIKSLFDLANAKDDFKRALEVVELNIEAAEKVKDRKALQSAKAQLVEVDQLSKKYALVADALKLLKNNPGDVAANQTVGEWYCFEKQNWSEAIPYLAISNNPDLTQLAKAELKKPLDAEEKMEIGDRYWELWDLWKADWERPEEAPALQARAVYWYQKAVPKLGGIVQKKVKKRIDSWKEVQEQIAAKALKEEQKSDKKAADKGKDRKEKQPVLAEKDSFLTELKALRPQAPRGPAGTPLWNLGGRVLIGNVPVQVGRKTDIYLHPFPQPQVSTLTYNLKGRYKTFSGRVGIPDVRAWRYGPGAPTVFSVSLDGKRSILHTTIGIRGKTRFTLDVTGVKKLVLETSCRGAAIDGCFAFWYSPQVSPEAPQKEIKTSPHRSGTIRIPGQRQGIPGQGQGFPGQGFPGQGFPGQQQTPSNPR